MRKPKKFFKKLVALIVALAAFVSPLADYLPIVGEGVKVSADSYWVGDSTHGHYANNSTALSEVKKLMKNTASSDAIKRFENILSEYPLSGYFNSKKTSACAWHCGGCGKEHEAETTCISYDGGKQCLGYAKYCFNLFFDIKESNSSNTKKTFKGYSSSEIKSFIEANNIPGIHFRLKGHSLVYLTYDSQNIYFIDANSGYNAATGCRTCPRNSGHYATCCKINLRKFSYSEFANIYKSYTVTVTIPKNSSGGGSNNPPPPSGDPVTIKPYNDTQKNTITDTNAILYGQVNKPSGYKITKIGIRVRVDGSTYDKGWSLYEKPSKDYSGYTYMYPYYDLNKELKATLTHATKYFFQFYAVVEGENYWSAEGTFTTTGKHSYGSWTTTKAATCTATGTKTRTCSCGAKETQTIAALGHSWSTSWSTGSTNHWHECTRCGATQDKANHSWNSGTVTKQSTCTAKGEKTYTCTVCKATKTESVAALGHSWSSSWSKDGSNHWHVCSRCNSTKDKAGHTYTTTVVPPSGSAQGYTLHTCTVCSYSYKDNYTTSGGTLRGDANGDGKVTSSDIIRIAQYIAGWKVTIDSKGADVNGDGKITSSDIIKLAQLLAGWKV